MKKYLTGKEGFTLIELLVVISIISLLSSIILAAVGTTRVKAITAAGQTFEAQMYQAYGANAIAIWNFDDGAGSLTAADTSGNNATLTITNPPASIQTGTVFRGASALSVVGTNVALPTTATLNTFNPSNGSVSFWVNINVATYTPLAGIFCNNNGGLYQFCILDDNPTGGNFISVYWAGSGSNNLATTIPISSISGKWTQVTVSWSYNGTTGTINIYVNGNQVATHAYTPSNTFLPPFSPYTFCVGGDCHGTDFTGYLDEMRVYSQSLQTGEIEKLYAEELPEHELARM